MTARIDDILRDARAQGVLPEHATAQLSESRPWPLLLLTAFGAWLAALPLIAVIGMVLGDVLTRGAGPYVVGLLLLAGALVVLRSRDLPVFVEQLAFPALLVGAGSLGMALGKDLPHEAGAAVLSAVMLGLGWAIPRDWLRVLLGAAAAVLAVGIVVPRAPFGGSLFAHWLALHAILAVWTLAMLIQQRGLDAHSARRAAFLEAVGAGWLLVAVTGLAVWSGMSLLVGGVLPSAPRGRSSPLLEGSQLVVLQAVSAALCVGAAALLARRWPFLRQPLAAAVAVVLALLAWFMPAVGGVLLALAWTAASQRWRLAAACALAAAWIAGAFYYRLEWTLASKALVLAGAGAVFALLAWLAHQRAHGGVAVTASVAPGRNRAAAWIAASAVLTLAVANYAIWEKEDLIARGEKLFVELAPVDPRSLMAGDYMQLNYRLPAGSETERGRMLRAQRPFVVVKRDARGVAQALRIVYGNEALAPGEMLVELTPKGGSWILVSDAWFFREGDGKRWEAAKYGEFRVLPDGRALLVGLADAQLRPIPTR